MRSNSEAIPTIYVWLTELDIQASNQGVRLNTPPPEAHSSPIGSPLYSASTRVSEVLWRTESSTLALSWGFCFLVLLCKGLHPATNTIVK